MMVKDVVESSEFLVSTDFFGDLSCVQPIGVSSGFLAFILATKKKNTLKNVPRLCKKCLEHGKPVKARWKWALDGGVSTL